MTTVTSERLGIQGLGWIVRRSLGPPAELAAFYGAAWGLSAPRPAGPPGSLMLWGGDLAMLELSVLTPGAGTQARVLLRIFNKTHLIQ